MKTQKESKFEPACVKLFLIPKRKSSIFIDLKKMMNNDYLWINIIKNTIFYSFFVFLD